MDEYMLPAVIVPIIAEDLLGRTALMSPGIIREAGGKHYGAN
jgi:hypothetical protein